MEYKISDFCKRQELPELSGFGIYKIQDEKGRTYVGSTTSSFRDRWQKHKNQLHKLKHHSSYLQNVYNKHGVNSISFSILEVVNDNNLILSREQYWIDYLKPEFNTLTIAGNSLGYKFPEDLRIKNRNTKRDLIRQSPNTGVKEVKKSGKFQATIRIDGHRINLGFYENYEEALEARKQGEILFWAEGFDLKSEEEKEALVKGFQTKNMEKRLYNSKLGMQTKRDTGKGVNFDKKSSKWRSTIYIKGKKKSLGMFTTKEEALKVRLESEQKYWLSGQEFEPKLNTTARKSGSDIKQVKSGRWTTRINTGKTRLYLGTFDTYEQALQARLDAEKKYWT